MNVFRSRGWFRFARRLLCDPRTVGAVVPSGAALAAAMAGQLDPLPPGRILELGPGTGAITQAIVERGYVPDRITAVEFDAGFADHLRGAFPGMRVVKADAFGWVKDALDLPFSAVVSSLPLLNFDNLAVDEMFAALQIKLPDHAPIIQFSYGASAPVAAPSGRRAVKVATVWKNMPPARVWKFETESLI